MGNNFDESRLQKRIVTTTQTIVPFNPTTLAKRNPEIKVKLSWKGDADLDIAVFMLDSNESLKGKYENLIYYNTERRWKPELDFNDENYNPLNGKVAEWPACAAEFENSNDKWFFATLPLSMDDSVIGPRDDRGEDGNNQTVENEEELNIRLSKIKVESYRYIAIVASIHQEEGKRPKKFSDIFDPRVNIYDADTNQQDIEYQLNNDNLNDCECVIVGYIKYNDETCRWDYLTADKGYANFAAAIIDHWS